MASSKCAGKALPSNDISSNSKTEKTKYGVVYKFEAEFDQLRNWPSRAVAWLAMMEQYMKRREKDGYFSDRQRLEFYTSMLGYGPGTRLMWARKQGQVKDVRTFIDWFKERYVDVVEKNRLMVRYENVRQTASVHQYILDFNRVHRANNQIVPLTRVIDMFVANLRNRNLAQWVENHRDPNMDLEDVMVMAMFCVDERRLERLSLECYPPLTADCIQRNGLQGSPSAKNSAKSGGSSASSSFI